MAAASVTIREFHLATSTEDDCRQWLRGRGLLAANMQCPHCNTVMQERLYTRVLDGVVYVAVPDSAVPSNRQRSPRELFPKL